VKKGHSRDMSLNKDTIAGVDFDNAKSNYLQLELADENGVCYYANDILLPSTASWILVWCRPLRVANLQKEITIMFFVQ
jgi:hypothetical protein